MILDNEEINDTETPLEKYIESMNASCKFIINNPDYIIESFSSERTPKTYNIASNRINRINRIKRKEKSKKKKKKAKSILKDTIKIYLKDLGKKYIIKTEKRKIFLNDKKYFYQGQKINIKKMNEKY